MNVCHQDNEAIIAITETFTITAFSIAGSRILINIRLEGMRAVRKICMQDVTVPVLTPLAQRVYGISSSFLDAEDEY